MALPITFASLTTIVSSYWDQNFAALGALTPIPCTVAGTDTLVLTPLANTPTVGSLQNYMQFTAIAGGTNTTAVTAQIGSLPVLPVYADTPSGPVPMTAGQIVANTAFTLMYDGTLNNGNGGFHADTNVITGAFLPLSGGTLTGPLFGTALTLSGALVSNSATVTGNIVGATVSATLVSATRVALTAGVSSSTSTITGLASAGAIQIGSGATLTRALRATAVFPASTIAAQGQTALGATISGASIGDIAQVSWPSDLSSIGLGISAGVVATNSVALKAFNYSSSSIAFAGGTCTVVVLGYS